MDRHLKEVSENWDGIWRGHNRSTKLNQKLEKAFFRLFPLPNSSKLIFDNLLGICQSNLQGKNIAECGSGTGLISKQLAKNGANVTLIDISPEAIDLSKKNLYGLKAQFIQASIMSLPLKSNSFDLVWNAGVIEHFKREQQKKAISEMVRIARPGGFVVLFNPCVCGKYYLKMKSIAENKGIWQAGYESPFETLNGLIEKKYPVKEYSIGYWTQFQYGKYHFRNKALQNMWILGFELASKLANPLNKREGYFLVTIVEKS
ncbi:MAG: class I SAM-dependent methyltransferase [Candidatus Aenigmarchaeota archaeon]|nr:class I SAM-dependent methyltransferase [Candidatus Aenigmarchaeota archaeon]